MRTLKKFGVLMVAVFALSVVGVASASAAEFTASSAPAELEGTQTSSQVFTTAASGKEKVTCTKAHTTGTVASKGAASQEVTVAYTGCTAEGVPLFGTAPAKITTAKYNLLAGGGVEIKNTLTISVEAPLFPCTITVAPQSLTNVTYDAKNSETELEETSAVTGIHSTSTGACPSGTTGTYTGNNLVHLVGGGFLRWDA